MTGCNWAMSLIWSTPEANIYFKNMAKNIENWHTLHHTHQRCQLFKCIDACRSLQACFSCQNKFCCGLPTRRLKNPDVIEGQRYGPVRISVKSNWLKKQSHHWLRWRCMGQHYWFRKPEADKIDTAAHDVKSDWRKKKNLISTYCIAAKRNSMNSR